MPYIGRSTDGFGVRNRFLYLASASDTSVSGADANGATLTFTDGAYVDVYLNGVLLKAGTDYNTNTANTIAGISSMSANDEVTVIVYDVFTVGDMVSATSGGTFIGAVTLSGGVTGDLDLNTDSAAIKFGADDDVTVTHDPDDGLILKSTATGDDNPFLLTLQTGETDLAANDVIGKIAFQAPDEGTGTDAILVSGAIQARAEGDHSASSNATSLDFMTGASEAATTKMTLTSAGRLGVGLTDPSDLFEVSNSADTPTRAIVTAEDSSGSAQNAFIKTKAKGSYYNGLELASTSGHVGFWGGYYSGSATMQARVGGSGVNSSDVQAIVIDSNGHVQMPNQSAFMAYLTTAVNNLTNGSGVTLAFQTEQFDLNSDYNTSNYTFTAPVNGKYLLTASVRLDSLQSNTNYVYTGFQTSNRNLVFWIAGPQDWNGSAYYTASGSVLCDMDANDTAYIYYFGQGGTDQADHTDGFFSAHLVA